MKKQRKVIPALIVAVLTSAGVYAEETPSSKNPLVLDGQTPDVRTVTERETYVNQVVASTVAGPGHVVVGQSNVVKATDGSTTVIGGQNFVADTAKDGNIFGDGSSITGYQSQAGGDNNHLIGEQNSAFGMNNQVNGNHTHAYGGGNNVTGDKHTAVGHGNVVTGEESVAIGYETKATGGESTIAIGNNAQATADQTTSIGVHTKATGAFSQAIGSYTVASGEKSVAIGDHSTAAGGNAISIGGSKAGAENNIAIGGSAITDKMGSVAIGNNALALGDYSTALGIQSKATGGVSTAIGDGAKASESWTTSLGSVAFATATNAVAVGGKSVASHANSVALGFKSETKESTQVTEATVGKLTYSGFAGNNPQSVVSVGTEGAERQIVNVGAGQINATSTDAINGSQLYATQDVINNVAGSVTTVLGGNSKVDGKGNITMTNIGGTGENTIHDAIKSHTDKIKANADGVAENAKNIETNTSDIRAAEKLIDANTKNITENIKAIEGNTNYIKAVENKLPEVQAGDNVTVTSTTDANGKITYTVSSKDYQPAIDAVNTKAETNKASIAENTKAIKENANGVAENKAGVEANKAKIAEVEVEAKRHSVVKAGKHTTVEQSTGANGEAVYTVSADVDNLATKAEVNKVSKAVAGNTKAIQANARAIGNLDRKIDKVEKKARAGIASAIAVANIPQVTLPGKSAVGIGAGGHAGQHAVAARYTRMSDNAKWIISGSVGVTSQKEVNYGAGVTYQW